MADRIQRVAIYARDAFSDDHVGHMRALLFGQPRQHIGRNRPNARNRQCAALQCQGDALAQRRPRHRRQTQQCRQA